MSRVLQGMKGKKLKPAQLLASHQRRRLPEVMPALLPLLLLLRKTLNDGHIEPFKPLDFEVASVISSGFFLSCKRD